MQNAFRAKRYDIFVSYKRDDDEARDVLCKALERSGFEAGWDKKIGAGNWRYLLRHHINQTHVVIALWSRNAAASPNELFMEMAHAFGLEKLLPVNINNAPVPEQFSQENFLPFDGWQDGRAAAQAAFIISEARSMGARPSLPPEASVDISGLPTGPPRLIGRDAEMAMLREAWREQNVNAVVIYGLGGAGKSALLRAFINERLAAGGDGAARIYGWSAYSQGSGEQGHADADQFIFKALSDFGYEGAPPKDPVARAHELAQLIQRERVLLVLDGLEPLQNPPGINRGQFKDRGLAALVKALGTHNPGLMVLTSRQEVRELEGAGPRVIHHELNKLSLAAGAELLVELGVSGRQKDLEDAVRELDGHALSVSLLATYLAVVSDGDVKQRDRFKFGEAMHAPTAAPGTTQIMGGYLEHLGELAADASRAGTADRVLLLVLGLFDRPADGSAVEVVLKHNIGGLTDSLFAERVERQGWFRKRRVLRSIEPSERDVRVRDAMGRLRSLRLLAKEDPSDPQGLDAHPLVRAYFAQHLQETAPEAARAAHELLYRHYTSAAPDLPDTLADMQPLFHAVGHGVKAGRVQEAFRDLYQRRIRRGGSSYIVTMLGAIAADLAAIAHFFEAPWTTPHRALNPGEQASLLGSAAYALSALGRLRESTAPRKSALDGAVALKDWRSAATHGAGLSQALLALGETEQAIAVARQAVAHAERSGEVEQRANCIGELASALAATGELERAAALFAEAVTITRQPGRPSPMLSFARSYEHGDVLLARGEAKEVLNRAQSQLELAQEYRGVGVGLHPIALAWLLTGRAQDALVLPGATASLNNAVDGLRRAGSDSLLPCALLARAAHRRQRVAIREGEPLTQLRQDLDETEAIAEPEMALYLTDLALERARLALDIPASVRGPEDEAARHVKMAAELIADIGYHRRDGELRDLQTRLGTASAA